MRFIFFQPRYLFTQQKIHIYGNRIFHRHHDCFSLFMKILSHLAQVNYSILNNQEEFYSLLFIYLITLISAIQNPKCRKIFYTLLSIYTVKNDIIFIIINIYYF